MSKKFVGKAKQKIRKHTSKSPTLENNEIDSPPIKCELIFVESSEDTTGSFLQDFGNDGKKMFPIYRTYHKDKIQYICRSGGKIVNGDAHFTDIGIHTYHALNSISVEGLEKDICHIQELKLGGKVSLIGKIKNKLESTPESIRICFIGDMAYELDSDINECFEIIGKSEL
jgi:hypothetical protein